MALGHDGTAGRKCRGGVASGDGEGERKIARAKDGDRPDRVEPRVVKRRPKAYPRMQVPRPIARSRLMRAS